MPPTNNERRLGLLTVNEACARLTISKSLLRNELRRHRLSVVRIGRRLFIPPETCEEIARIGLRPFDPHTRGRGQ